ncbi:MAG: hypothetical protein ABI175_22820, partial [Polyangiales bacterium]
DPSAGIVELRTALDGVRLGLIAHAEAEDIVLGAFDMVPALEILIGQARAAHVTQEKALTALVCARPQTSVWRDRAYQLRELVAYHAAQEEAYLLPALRHHVPADHYGKLAGSFATQRLRQLAMLQPSGLYPIPNLAEAHAS